VNVEATVARLADLEAIRDLARRSAHFVWRRDADGAVALFAEDAEMDTGDRPPIRGRAALLEAYRTMFAVSEFHPTIHNHVIELDGDFATGTCYLAVEAVIEGASRVGSGTYADRYARIAGEWKFESRKLAMCYLVESELSFTP
jgi:ketosteroid isomerase-like protein